MGRDAITVTGTVRTGVAPATTVPSDVNDATIVNIAGHTILVFISGLGAAAVGAGARTIVAIQVADPYGRLVAETPLVIVNDTVVVLGPWPPLLYNQPTTGVVNIDYAGLSTNQAVFGLQIGGA